MKLRTFLRIVELRTKIVSLVGLLVGSLAAYYLDGAFSLRDGLLLWAAAFAVDMGTTAFNSYFDYYNRADDRAFNRESDKVLVHEGVPPGEALLAGLGLFALALVLGFVLSLSVGFALALFGALSMAVGFFYTAGPLPISRTPFGELVAGAFLGFGLPLVAYYVFARRLGQEAALLALPSFFLVASILAVNNACDAVGDRAAGRRTLAIVAGPAFARLLVPALGLAGWAAAGATVAAGILPPAALLPLAPGFVAAAAAYAAILRRGCSHETKGPNMGAVSLAYGAYGLSMSAALVAAILTR